MSGLTNLQSLVKRIFDVNLSGIGLVVTGPIILVAWLLATVDTRSNGFFFQSRVGRHGRIFSAIKIRTMRSGGANDSTVTVAGDRRITRLGKFLRQTKIDELPQLFNVFVGNMSFVGPRPDVPGYADQLEGHDRIILSVRPGITGPATLKYRNEEQILASVENPESYNRTKIYPDKVRLNRVYVENWSFGQDIKYILRTIFGR